VAVSGTPRAGGPHTAAEDRLATFILDPAWDQPRVAASRLTYLIASEPRTGSNLLCEMLRQSGVAGVPHEYFHAEAVALVRARAGHATPAAYLADLVVRRTTPNGVFGVKAHGFQLAAFVPQVRGALPPLARVVRVTRRDVVAQAVSLAIARRTGIWSRQGAEAPADPALAYDFGAIAGALALVQAERARWAAFQARLRRAPLVLDYEAIAADPGAACALVLRFLDSAEPPAQVSHTPAATKLGGRRNADWVERFRNEAARHGVRLD